MITASKYKQEKSLLFLIKIIFSSIRNTLGIIGASTGGPTRHLLPNEVITIRRRRNHNLDIRSGEAFLVENSELTHRAFFSRGRVLAKLPTTRAQAATVFRGDESLMAGARMTSRL
jgi:hypothetical protein